MAITINGSGTVTGISVGGLPDGIVDNDTLANTTITDAKIANTTITDAKIANTTISEGKLAANVNTIQGADEWRLTSNVAGAGSAADISANLERNDTAGFEKIGDGMSESSGVFTFPLTGKWLILAKCTTYNERNGYNYYQRLDIFTTHNDSSWTVQSTGYDSHAVQYTRGGMDCSFIFDVTNTSTHKAKFQQYTYHGTDFILGNTDRNFTTFTFIRLGDT